MYNQNIQKKVLMLSVFLAVFASITIWSVAKIAENTSNPPQSCTIATVSIGNNILFGNNEDFSLKGTSLWFVPSENGYGSVIFGYLGNWHFADKFAQGGMNDQGLCCDANALSDAPLNRKPDYERAPMDFFPLILRECANVNETIEWFQTHNFGSAAHGQFHFADATGDAVVISAGIDGEWKFTRIEDSKYLLSTNFNVVNPDNGWYPCWRYDAAEEKLIKFASESDVNVENVSKVMQSAIQTGTYATQYTNIFNPKTLDFYVWHSGNFSRYVEFNLAEELQGLEKTTYYKIPVLLGMPDWFFPPQFPTFAVLVAAGVSVTVYLTIWLVRKIRAKKIASNIRKKANFTKY